MPNGMNMPPQTSVGICPKCGSWRIRRRRRRHPRVNWRCRNCNTAFPTPKYATYNTHNIREIAAARSERYFTATDVAKAEGRWKPVKVDTLRPRRRKSSRLPWVIAGGLIAALIFVLIVWGRNPNTELESAQVGASGLTTQPVESVTTLQTSAGQQTSPTPASSAQTSSALATAPTPESPAQTSMTLPVASTPVPTTRGSNTPTPAPPTRVLNGQQTAPKPELELRANLRHMNEKEYMLEKINSVRTQAGVPTVVLGENIAAQLHAESALKHCFASHWGIDGLKPYMRYSLAGGYQSNAENGHGSDYCITSSDNYAQLGSVRRAIDDAMEGWMDSSGHRRNLLDPTHRKVNIGLAWDRYNFKAYQHFEGDYTTFDGLPTLEDGILTLSGTTRNGMTFSGENGLGVMVYYDAAPYPLTQGQVARTYCYNNGLLVAALLRPMPEGYSWEDDSQDEEYSRRACPNPFDVSPDAPAARSVAESHRFWDEAYAASKKMVTDSNPTPWLVAAEWSVSDDMFSVKADLSQILTKHGSGVYTVKVWGMMNGEDAVAALYSIFHNTAPPPAYAVEQAKEDVGVEPGQSAAVVASPTPTPKPAPVKMTAARFFNHTPTVGKWYILTGAVKKVAGQKFTFVATNSRYSSIQPSASMVDLKQTGLVQSAKDFGEKVTVTCLVKSPANEYEYSLADCFVVQ